MLSDLQKRLADLYWQTKSVRFGEFRLSIHRDQPDLQYSPIYLHYPVHGVTDELRELFSLAGELLVQTAKALKIRPYRRGSLWRNTIAYCNAKSVGAAR